MRKVILHILAAIIFMTSIFMASITVNAARADETDLILERVNKARSDAGLNTLTLDEDLSKAAAVRAKELATSFSHVRPDGTQFYTVCDKVYGENLAKGNSQHSVDEIITMWLNSKVHRGNILYKTSTITGIAIYEAPDGSIFIAEMFD